MRHSARFHSIALHKLLLSAALESENRHFVRQLNVVPIRGKSHPDEHILTGVSSPLVSAEQFQRATQLNPQRIDMNTGLNNSYNSITQLKREVDSYKQRQQEIVSFDQVRLGFSFCG